MSAPKFSFDAASTEAADKSGIAIWRYDERRRGEIVEVIVRQRFDSFAAAHEINNLIHRAYEAGVSHGKDEVIHKLEATLKGIQA